MSVLEEKIKRNKNVFNDKKPEPGHRERFLARLDELHGPKAKAWYLSPLPGAVAAILLVGLASWFVVRFLISKPRQQQAVIHTITLPEEMQTVLAWYDAQAVDKMKAIDQVTNNPVQANKVREELNGQLENIDISLAALQKNYTKDPGNEVLKAALIKNKRKKVEVVDRVIRQLDIANSQLY